MSLFDLSELVLQRAAHRVLADGARMWTCTNGDTVQVLSPGLINVHEGPDLTHMAVLHNGCVNIGAGEFHVYASSWHSHGHSSDPRYRSVMMHVVLAADVLDVPCRWTLALPIDEVGRTVQGLSGRAAPTSDPVDELQRAAMMRLNRATVNARAVIFRHGLSKALKLLTSEWFEKFSSKRRHPIPQSLIQAILHALPTSALGTIVIDLNGMRWQDLLTIIETSERLRIASEGASIRRELVVNVILPCCCAFATPEQKIMLLQWYWSARTLHSYGLLRRRFPDVSQDYVWQQQGMLEFLRKYG